MEDTIVLHKKLPLTVLFLLFWLCSNSHATSLYYILDGSGSMWGRVDGQIKIVAAKKVMSGLITYVDKDTGLTADDYRRYLKSINSVRQIKL